MHTNGAASLLLMKGHVTKGNGTSCDLSQVRSLAGVSRLYGDMIREVSMTLWVFVIYGRCTVEGSCKHLSFADDAQW